MGGMGGGRGGVRDFELLQLFADEKLCHIVPLFVWSTSASLSTFVVGPYSGSHKAKPFSSTSLAVVLSRAAEKVPSLAEKVPSLITA